MEVNSPAEATPTNLAANEEVVRYLPKLREWGVSVIRSVVVPPIAAFVVLFLANKIGWELDKDDPTLTAAIFTAVTGVWYSAMRAVEVVSHRPWFVKIAGVLLGSTKAPAARVNAVT